ncbi:hypothetical protein SAMN05720764_102123 [Fibrobacter sp. UWH5]|uniref:hypothetical protein n=1 Tax=Fibrobacter sp. UWH5 TaxID=1896211 RepID=UPI0009180FB5|nr:hypothetical protein [Fibrobacter sp. UWH5]SHK59888.1 hypothetical protein SAMN05720764_102123 [Fibrobacter sp. UWH5]
MFKNAKKGVSLVAVLLFMMIATIAATATYKWLSSSGFSSASRLYKNEAQQAAYAGIASARAWMTYHGNETGAAIRQYLTPEPDDRVPVRLTNVLKSVANSNNQQDFDVWIVDANTETLPYTVKLVSVGKARNGGAKHSEVAVLKISGLYQVQIPAEQSFSGFNDAFHGSLASAGNLKVNSATINGSPDATNGGGSAFSSVEVEGDLIITGSAEFNSNSKVGNLYVVEDFSRCTNVKVMGNAYVGGKWYATMGGNGDTIYGDLFARGGLDLTTRGPNAMGGCGGSIGGILEVKGNLTLGAASYMPTNNSQSVVHVGKNLTVDDKLIFNTNGNGNQWGFQFDVTGNSYIKNGLEGDHKYYDIERVSFGSPLSATAMYAPGLTPLNTKYENENIPSTYYCNDLDCVKSGEAEPEYGGFFKVYSTYYASGAPSQNELKKWRADSLDAIAQKIIPGGKEKGCETDLHVKDPLQFNKDVLSSSYKITSTNKSSCTWATLWNSWPSDWVDELNKCYASELGASKLYKDKWLVAEFSNPQWKNSSTLLEGNFILIINGTSPTNQIDLPDMTENSNVFIYFPDGWNHTITLKTSSTGKKNYFIYSDGDIKDFQMNLNDPMTGSIYMANCSALNTGTHNAAVAATANSSLTQALAEINVICDNDETDKCSADGSGSGSGSGGSSSTNGDKDSYYIAAAPQLYIRTESQYRNNELSVRNVENDGVDLAPSIIVLPRILYLPANPYGTLADYYDVVNLNGATAQKNPAAVTCSPSSMPTMASFSSYGDLSANNGKPYRCNYAGNTFGAVPFYIVVAGDRGNPPPVQFVDENIEINKNEIKRVAIKVNPSANGQPVNVDVYQSPLPSNWTVTGASAHTINADGSRVYTVTVTPHATDVKTFNVFTVEMPSNGESSAVTFQMIDPCDGCIIGHEYDHTTIVAGGSFNVNIKPVDEFCALDENENNEDCKVGGKLYKVMQAESCSDKVGSSAWVRANGIGCSPEIQNEKWSCSVFIDPNVQLQGMKNNMSTECEVTVAPKEIYSARVDTTIDLYASITRKSYPLYLKITGAKSGSEVSVSYSKTSNATQGDVVLATCDKDTVITAYHGYKYFFNYKENGDDEFAAWKCEGKSCPFAGGKFNNYGISVSDTNIVTARFNEEDEHCFYEDFDDDKKNVGFPTKFCDGSDKRCIDTCDYKPMGIGKSCALDASVHKGSKPEWVMVYDNRPLKSVNSQRPVRYDQTVCEKTEIRFLGVHLGDRYSPSGCEKRLYENTQKNYNEKVLYPDVSGGYIAAKGNAEANANDINGTQSIILSTKQTGTNGTMTSLFTTGILGTKFDFPSLTDESAWRRFFSGEIHPSRYDFENSGFIFRSNKDATEYFSLSVFGLADVGSIYSDKIYAHLCLVREQTAASIGRTRCETQELPIAAWETTGNLLTDITQELMQGLGITIGTKFGMTMKVSGKMLSLDFTLDRLVLKDGQKNIKFDLSKFGETLEGNEYVGLKLSNPRFKVYDVSWQSDTYAGDCWATPRILCSFRTNYPGAIIPLEENAKPWVVLSSFDATDYENIGCSIKYYYNGCDNTTTSGIWTDYSKDNLWGNLFSRNSCNNNPDNLGLYWDDGAAVSGGVYNFNREGQHGYIHENGTGIVKDAKVKLNCQSATVTPPSSLTASQSCGQFLVGDIVLCEKNYDFMQPYSSAIQCNAGANCVVEYDVSNDRPAANLRNASVYYKLNSGECRGNVYVNVVDSLGNASENIIVPSNSDSYFDMDDYLDANGFDPQRIKEVRFTSTECDFEIQHVESECPYALGIKSCTARYTGSSWIVSAEVRNADECKVIVPDNSQADVSDLNGSCVSQFRIPEPGLYANASATDNTYQFKLEATNATTGESVLKECIPYDLEPIDIACHLSSYEVEQGAGIPTLNYSFTNCPEGGCSYKISLEGSMVSGVSDGSLSSQNFDGFNSVGYKLDPGYYNFVIDVQGKTNEECGFTVVAPSENKTASASNCHFNVGTKAFTAAISYTGSSWDGKLYATDGLGHELGLLGAVTGATEDYVTFDLENVDFTVGSNRIVLILNNENNGSTGCTEEYIVAASSSSVASSSSATGPSADYQTICMVKDVDSRTNHPKVTGPIPSGTYVFKHNCGVTKQWWLYCTGTNITIDGSTFACKGTGATAVGSNSADINIPASGRLLDIPSGTVVTSISCDRATPLSKDPEGCIANGIVGSTPPPQPPSSSSIASSSSASKYSATCDITPKTMYGRHSPDKLTFVSKEYTVNNPTYYIDLFDDDSGDKLASLGYVSVNNCNKYYCKSDDAKFDQPTEGGRHSYTLRTDDGDFVCSVEVNVLAASASSCSVSPKTSIAGGANYTFSAVLNAKKANVGYEVYVDGEKKSQGDGWADDNGKFDYIYSNQWLQFDNGRHAFALYSMGEKLCEDYVDVGDYPACQAEVSDGTLSSSVDGTKIRLKNVQNCASGCNYVVKLGTQQFLSGSKSIQQSWDATEIGTISGKQLERGNHQITVELTNSLGSGSCSFWLNRW